MKKLITFLVIVSIFSATIIAQNGPKLRRIEGKGNDGQILDFVNGMHDSILQSSTNKYDFPLYDNNKGPVYVDIYNPSLTPSGDFAIIFDDTTTHSIVNDLTDYSSRWHIVHLPTSTTFYSDTILGVDSTQDIAAWGMKIRTRPMDDPGTSVYSNNGFLEATMTFANPAAPWLTGLSDEEGMNNKNWIRSGTSILGSPPGSYFNDASGVGTDPSEAYENSINGTWAPYRLCAYSTPPITVCRGGPAWPTNISLNKLSNIASVDVVITTDQSKWTRCPVIEEQESTSLALGGAQKLSMRNSPSVDKNGMPNYPATYNNDFPTGMGWFPGYAINLETGERLNMAFGEDSWLTTENGADMKWNPTSLIDSANVIFGGKHYIYIFGHNGDATFPPSDIALPNGLRDIPLYDQGAALHELFIASTGFTGSAGDAYKREIYTDAMWVNIPLLNPGYTLLQTDVNIRLRVSKKYRQYATNNANSNNPMYTFNAGTIIGINDYENNNSLSIYPNPASDNITINFTSTSKNASIKIYDARGRLVKNIENVKSGENMISLNELGNGLYLINVGDGKSSVTKRFVKQ